MHIAVQRAFDSRLALKSHELADKGDPSNGGNWVVKNRFELTDDFVGPVYKVLRIGQSDDPTFENHIRAQTSLLAQFFYLRHISKDDPSTFLELLHSKGMFSLEAFQSMMN